MSNDKQLQSEKAKWQEAMINPKAKKVSFLTWLIELATFNWVHAEQEYQYQQRNAERRQKRD